MADFRDFLSSSLKEGRPVFLDGGMGTMINASCTAKGISCKLPEELNTSHPEVISSIHEQYRDAGAQILTSNTFGANPIKMASAGLDWEVAVKAGVGLVTGAAHGAKIGPCFGALDIGPTGKLMEVSGGELSFDDAYACFAKIAKAGSEAGAELVIIETMSDLYELKAAVLAVRENTRGKNGKPLPFIVSVTFQSGRRMLSGADVETAFTYLSSLHPDALGWNCGGDLKDAALLTESFCKLAAERQKAPSIKAIPILVQPNAGAPIVKDGVVSYPVEADEFAEAQLKHYRMGARLLGGCCGTRPEYIKAMRSLIEKENFSIADNSQPASVKLSLRLCTGVSTLRIGEEPVLIGERINPANRPELQGMLKELDYESISDEAGDQIDAGAQALDINVTMAGIDEKAAMLGTIEAIQGLYMRNPLVIDSTEPAVIEAALRSYNGRALINSVSAKQKSLDSILPLAAKYGAAVVGLCLDDRSEIGGGTKADAEEKVAIAEKIITEAEKYGIAESDILIDTLAMPASVSVLGQPVLEALRAISLLKANHPQVKTILGISNVSFGLPKREALNAAFLTMALYAGLDAAIANPLQQEVQDALGAYRKLAGID
jgi:5-methyltetrahydrofolate--homocysteine methyltransferase